MHGWSRRRWDGRRISLRGPVRAARRCSSCKEGGQAKKGLCVPQSAKPGRQSVGQSVSQSVSHSIHSIHCVGVGHCSRVAWLGAFAAFFSEMDGCLLSQQPSKRPPIHQAINRANQPTNQTIDQPTLFPRRLFSTHPNPSQCPRLLPLILRKYS